MFRERWYEDFGTAEKPPPPPLLSFQNHSSMVEYAVDEIAVSHEPSCHPNTRYAFLSIRNDLSTLSHGCCSPRHSDRLAIVRDGCTRLRSPTFLQKDGSWIYFRSQERSDDLRLDHPSIVQFLQPQGPKPSVQFPWSRMKAYLVTNLSFGSFLRVIISGVIVRLPLLWQYRLHEVLSPG